MLWGAVDSQAGINYSYKKRWYFGFSLVWGKIFCDWSLFGNYVQTMRKEEPELVDINHRVAIQRFFYSGVILPSLSKERGVCVRFLGDGIKSIAFNCYWSILRLELGT